MGVAATLTELSEWALLAVTCCHAQTSVLAIHHIEVCGNRYKRSFRPFAFKILSKSSPKARRGPAADHRVNKDDHHRTAQKMNEESLQHQKNVDFPIADQIKTNSVLRQRNQ